VNAKNEINVEAGALACLSAIVDQLKEEGLSNAGQYEGLFSYAVLSRLKSEAEAFGVPLRDIGLANFNPDMLLKKQARPLAA